MPDMNSLQTTVPNRVLDALGRRPLPAAWSAQAAPAAVAINAEPRLRLQVSWARHDDELRQAQRLRHRVLADRPGAAIPGIGSAPLAGTPPELDVDRFDGHCEHLLLRTLASDTTPAWLVATCRILTPAGARRAGGLHGETLFDLSRLAALRPRIVELGRCWVDPAWRGSAVMPALGSALADFMLHNDLDIGFGCASLPLHDGGHHAASLWRRLQRSHAASDRLAAIPWLPMPIKALRDDLQAAPPALLQGLLQCGAKLLGAPAWDPDFGSAELPMILQLAYLPAAFRLRPPLC